MELHNWLTLPAIRSLSLDGRGLLADLIKTSTDPAEHLPGFLTELDLPLYLREMAHNLSVDRRLFDRLFADLINANLVKNSEYGWFFPTIVRIHREHLRRVETGSMGGNPNLPKKHKPTPNPVRHSSQSDQERLMFQRFWYRYPVKKHMHQCRKAFHMLEFPNYPEQFETLMDHLLNRLDDMIGDPDWVGLEKNIPEPTEFIRKQLWYLGFTSRIEENREDRNEP